MANPISNRVVISIFLAGVLLAACTGTAGSLPDANTLDNTTYSSEFSTSGEVTLVDGEFREQAAPDSATETVVQRTNFVASGELNGEQVAATILVSDPGGSGTFYSLHVVDREGNEVASTFLGDRVMIESLSIDDNQIQIETVTHGPDDPMCCPTQQVTQTYELQGDQLVLT